MTALLLKMLPVQALLVAGIYHAPLCPNYSSIQQHILRSNSVEECGHSNLHLCDLDPDC